MSSPPSTHPLARPVRILYADDVRELRELARVVFVRDGHSIECAEDGAEALDKIRADLSAFDLVITDHHMPRMNGLELVRALRQLNFPGKILIFSSELNPSVAKEYENLLVEKILFKPVLPSGLRQVIAGLFPAESAVIQPALGRA